MFKSLKSIFILSTLLALSICATSIIGQTIAHASGITANDLSILSNQERSNNGLAQLSINSQLTNAAYAKANYMIANNYWAHNAPDGTTPWSFIVATGYDYISAGENLAKDFSTSAGVISGWMNSPTHRANVLNSSYTEVGYAVVDGFLLGSQTTLIVAMYGLPVAPVVVPAVVTTPPPVSTPVATVDVTEVKAVSYNPVVNAEVVTSSSAVNNADISTIVEAPVVENRIQPLLTDQKTKTVTDLKSQQLTSKKGKVAGVSTVDGTFQYFNAKTLLAVSVVLSLMLTSRYMLTKRKDKKGQFGFLLKKRSYGASSILFLSFLLTSFFYVGTIM